MKVNLETGDKFKAERPVIELVEGGEPYLWVGGDDGCFGHIDAAKARKLAERLLALTD